MTTFRIFAAYWLSVKANQLNILEAFGIPLNQIWLIFYSFQWEKKSACFGLYVSLVLMQNEDIGNFHGSLTLNKGKLTWYSGSLWYAIVSNMTQFFHSVWNEKKWPVLNYVFHQYWRKMKTFGIFTAHWLWIKGNWLDSLEAFGMPLCQIWLILSFCLGWENKWPVLNYVFHLYWRKMKTFGIFMAHWLWMMEN